MAMIGAREICSTREINSDATGQSALSLCVTLIFQIKRVKDADEVPMVCKYPRLYFRNVLLLHIFLITQYLTHSVPF